MICITKSESVFLILICVAWHDFSLFSSFVFTDLFLTPPIQKKPTRVIFYIFMDSSNVLENRREATDLQKGWQVLLCIHMVSPTPYPQGEFFAWLIHLLRFFLHAFSLPTRASCACSPLFPEPPPRWTKFFSIGRERINEKIIFSNM